MRSEQEMLDLIVTTARRDERIRAVILNGSRANPDARRDIFQDFDVVYLVTDIAPFKEDPAWIDRFGERVILQLPDAMDDPPPRTGGPFAYLMQFADGNRIDLTLYPLAMRAELGQDSLSLVLLDKDGNLPPLAVPSDRDYFPRPPTAKAYADCCNEFWWVCTSVAKGLWRGEITYAKAMLDRPVREQLMKMLAWHLGVKTGFSCNPGQHGKHFEQCLHPELWALLLRTYADAGADNTWEALFTMCDLFRRTALEVAERFGFEYPRGDDEKVSAHLKHVRALPKNATAMY